MSESTEPLAALHAALAAAQAELPNPGLDRAVNAGSRRYNYATLGNVLSTIRPVLGRHGLAISQRVLTEGEAVVVETLLLHREGGMLSSAVAWPAPRDLQAMGSALTYLRRYAVMALVGVAGEEDDDDGQRGRGRAEPEPQRRPEPAQRVEDLPRYEAPAPAAPAPAPQRQGGMTPESMTGRAILERLSTLLEPLHLERETVARLARAMLGGRSSSEVPLGDLEDLYATLRESEIPADALRMAIRPSPSGTTGHAADWEEGRKAYCASAAVVGGYDALAKACEEAGLPRPSSVTAPEREILLRWARAQKEVK